MRADILIEVAKARAEGAIAERKPLYEIANSLKDIAAAIRELSEVMRRADDQRPQDP